MEEDAGPGTFYRLLIARLSCENKDIIEEVCEDKLDPKLFPYFGGGPVRAGGRGPGGPESGGPISARYGQWHRDKTQQQRTGPRLIFFILGGISYSEMRCAYEVMELPSGKNWDILVGGTHLLVPEAFLSDLEKLSYMPGAAPTQNTGPGGGASAGVSSAGGSGVPVGPDAV
ncbi:unnamed protein product [Protopolystoma xenopodis]|uniref:Uncharacterized protein n=1 Tax=Protopolystoma xenopodis TaxID=117903 RepID=A0A448XCB8_9PLAT|nr:unnamed protein product [Protopolystoma xenopodis]